MKSLFSAFASILLAALFAQISPVPAQTPGNQTDAKPANLPDFVLSPSAKAAGIDGKMQIGMTISANGKASDLRIYGGPMWPCGSDPKDEAEKVRKEVKQLILSATFEPATKNGKPVSSDVQITFLLSELFRDAVNTNQIEENLKKGINPPLVEIRDLSRFALSIPKQIMGSRRSLSPRWSEIQVLIDENGNVASAGGFRGGPGELIEARDLACSAKFKPLLLNNKPVKMTGIIAFGLY